MQLIEIGYPPYKNRLFSSLKELFITHRNTNTSHYTYDGNLNNVFPTSPKLSKDNPSKTIPNKLKKPANMNFTTSLLDLLLNFTIHSMILIPSFSIIKVIFIEKNKKRRLIMAVALYESSLLLLL